MNILISAIVSIALVVGSMLFVPNDYGGDDDSLGATSFPSSLDTLTNPASTDKTNSPSHSTQHTNANDALEALEAKIGVNGSAVTTSHDYKLSGVTGSDKSVSLTGSETLTNKTLTSPFTTNLTATNTTLIGVHTVTGTTTLSGKLTLTLGSDATGDVFYRNSSGYLTRLGIGSDGQVLKLASGLPTWASDSAGASVIVRAYATTSQTLSTSFEKLNFAEEFDTGADFATGTFTAPSDGYYDISASVVHNFVRAIDTAIYVNGVASSTGTNGANDSEMIRHIADTLFLETGDTVQIWAKYQGTVASITVTSGITNTRFIVKGL